MEYNTQRPHPGAGYRPPVPVAAFPLPPTQFRSPSRDVDSHGAVNSSRREWSHHPDDALLRAHSARPARARGHAPGALANSHYAVGKRAGFDVELTAFEFNILELLLRMAGRVVARDQVASILD